MTNLSKLQFGKSSGFTLIEVLVASVILFSVIATVSMVYRGAFMSSEKANQHIKISGVLPIVLANIRNDIRELGSSLEPQISQKGNAWEVSYIWQATLEQHNSAPTKLDVDSGDYVTPPPKYKLWLVDLQLQLQTTTKQYQFYEMSWSND